MKLNFFYFTCLLLLFSCSYSSSDYTDDLGDGYIFVSESNADQFVSGPNDTTGRGLIPCTVEAFAFDKTYIIAKQRNNQDCSQADLSTIPASYWVIDKKKKITYGPLDSTAFIGKRAELSVPTSLDLKE